MEAFSEQQLHQLKEITGQRQAPKMDWFKLGLGIAALLGALFGATSYLFVTDARYRDDRETAAVDAKAQELFNDYLDKRVTKLEANHN